MNQIVGLTEILQIEDCPEILDFKCEATGIPLWTTIRVPFIRSIMGELLYDAPIVRGVNIRGRVFEKAFSTARAFVHNGSCALSESRHFPVVIVSTGVRLAERDGRLFNALSDYFVGAALNETKAIEDMFDWRWPFPRHHENVLIQTPYRVVGYIRGRWGEAAYRKSALRLVDLVALRAKKILGWEIGDERREWLIRQCATSAASLFPRYRAYQSLFDRLGARLLIKEEACYGGADSAAALLAARHRGLVTAEYQHGAVSAGHDAYNFARELQSSQSFRDILPDYFLAYGSWWGDQISAPIKSVAIGNPHRTETLAAQIDCVGEKSDILVLGDGIETDLYLELCQHLAASLLGVRRVVFRPHPLERSLVSSRYPDGIMGNVSIDQFHDIYSSFRKADAVISELSSGLFEAIGLVPRIFMWDTPKARFAFPVHPFACFSDVVELNAMLNSRDAGCLGADVANSLWAQDWQKNYLDFLEKAIQ